MVGLLLFTALLEPSAVIAVDAPPVVAKGCYSPRAQQVVENDPSLYHRLDQLPPASEILTVIHSIDGCQKPVVVRYGIGGNRASGSWRTR